jgi:hypothetical protein
MNVEAVLGNVDAEDGAWFVHDPTLRMRAQAQAAVRVRTLKMEAAPSSVSGFRAPGERGLTSTSSLAVCDPAGNSDIQGDPSSDTA